MANLPNLVTKAVELLKSDTPLETVYPLLRSLSSELEKLYHKHPGPQVLLRFEKGFWMLWTHIPEVDYQHEAEWSDSVPLTIEESTELRTHLITILQCWLAEDALFSQPYAKQDVAAMLGLTHKSVEAGVKALNRMINADPPQLRVVEVNKNMIRILYSDLPKKYH